MRIVDLILKKEKKEALTKEEINFIISEYVSGKMPDYQMSALLMAIVFNSMDYKETADLTQAMMHSGKVFDLSTIKGIKVDKHSTGGIGDKTTLAVAPIIAALGVPVAKMSGRGLGQTGGTIDKLESIPGFKTEYNENEFIELVQKSNIAIIGQSNEVVPADKRMYALRDVTGTVASLPLISSSIMSKKLATGSDAILLDVKCGNGAFMNTYKEAKELANTMINIGKHLNVDVRAEITNMNRPIGREIGNKNEVLEAVKTLKGNGPEDFNELVFSSCETILLQAKRCDTKEEAKLLIKEVIENGKALDKFYEMVKNQGGDIAYLKSKDFWKPLYSFDICARKEGYVEIFDAFLFGTISMKLGAGRETKADIIDNEAGITIHKKTNEYAKVNDVLFTLYSSKPIDKSLEKEISNGYRINKEKVKNKIILGRLS